MVIDEKVKEVLRSNGLDLCPLCLLRLSGTHDEDKYINCEIGNEWATQECVYESDSTQLGLDDEKDPKYASRRICSVCYGLLHLDYKNIAMKLKEKFNLESYKLPMDSKKFSISISSLPQIFIRQKLVEIIVSDEKESDSNLKFAMQVKGVFKILILKNLPPILNLEYDRESPLTASFTFSHEDTKKELQILKSSSRGKKIKSSHYPIDLLQKLIAEVKIDDYKKHCMSKPEPIARLATVGLSLYHASIYVGGRYLKLVRGISNSKWIINNERVFEHSMEELIVGEIIKHFRCDGKKLPQFQFSPKGYKFYSCGREDTDVLTLGNGRPFYFQLLNPRKITVTNEEIKDVQESINSERKDVIMVKDLHVISDDDVKLMKQAEGTKDKSYRVLIETSRPISMQEMSDISGMQELKIAQRNPTRTPRYESSIPASNTLKRRADIVRNKVIRKMNLRPSSPDAPYTLLTLELTTSAGTYVKEFVHGDNGRTVPSLVSLINCERITVRELDVTWIHLNWP